MEEAAGNREGGTRFWPWVLLSLIGWMTYVLSLEARNPRLVASWHGFLHTAISTRFPSPTWTPENPFYAGEPLHYYWVYHRVAAGLSSFLDLDPLSALRLLTLIALVLLIIFAALAGRRAYRTTGAAIMVGFLALVGMNPAGPLVAEARHLKLGAPMLETESLPVTDVVSNAAADSAMSHNLLPMMYLSTDWRNGQNIVWFFDISARGLSLAMIAALLWLLAGSAGWGNRIAVTLVTSIAVAFNPIVGLAVSGMLGFSLAVIWFLNRREAMDWQWGWKRIAGTVVALIAGVCLAAPTFYQLLGQGGGSTHLTPPGLIVPKLANLTVNFVILLPLALLALRINLGQHTVPLRATVLAALLLLAVVVLVRMEEGNEHNITNSVQVLLALPAVAWLVWDRAGNLRPVRERRMRLGLAALLFVPVTLGTWMAFDGRPPLPFRAAQGELVRTPDTDPLAQLYAWIRTQTPANAVFVTDPVQPVKMSGNVSELPAFTRRTLFVDKRGYMIKSYPDLPQRTALASKLLQGEPASDEEVSLLGRLQRPVYMISYHTPGPLLDRLVVRYGQPAFQAGPIEVFRWSTPGKGTL